MAGSDTEYDVIVVGSGAGGLSAAAALSVSGVKVLVLEAMTDFGGYLNPFRREKYCFDAGMHYLGQLGEGGVFRALLERLGAWEHVEFNEIEPDGFIRFVCGDVDFRLPAGPEAMEERFAEHFPAEAFAIKSFFETVLRIDRAVEAAAEMGAGIGAWFEALPHLPFLVSVLPKTYFELITSFTSTPKLQAALCMMPSGLPAKQVSALVPALMFRHYLDGAFYPKGGSGALRDALVKVITGAGNNLQNHARVEQIGRHDDGFVVQAGAREWNAKSVICDADPTMLYGKLLDPALVGKKLKRRVEKMVPSNGAFYAYAVTELDLASMGVTSATIQHCDSLEAMMRTEWTRWAEFEHFMLSCTTMKDPAGNHAPKGQHVIELVAPAPFQPFEKWAAMPSMQRGDEYLRFKVELGLKLIEKAERYVPGLSRNIKYVDFATPVTNHYWVNVPGGGCYGPAHLPSQVGRRRFAIKSRVPGLFLSGHGTLAGGVYPSMRSGELAASLALRCL